MLTATIFEYLKSFKEIKKDFIDLIIVEDDQEATTTLEIANFLKIKAVCLPNFTAVFLDDLRSYKLELNELFLALYSYYKSDSKALLISPIKSLFHKFPKENLLQIKSINFGDNINYKEFKSIMHTWGYHFVDIVQMEGEISFRGDIIDIFSIGSKEPLRISLFDEEIESIRYFNLDTQKSSKNELESFDIFPAFLSFTLKQKEHLQTLITTKESDHLSKDIYSVGFWYLNELSDTFIAKKSSIATKDFSNLIEDAYTLDNFQVKRDYFDTLKIMPQANNYKNLQATNITTLISLHKDKNITIITRNQTALKQEGLFSLNKNIKIVEENYTFCVISSTEIIISINKREKKVKKRKASILLDELKPGDYVVHEEYGVAFFENIIQVTIMGAIKDFLTLCFKDNDKVLIPVDCLQVISRYIANSGTLPILDSIGKGSFAKLKEKVKNRLFIIAGEIINLAASRALLKAPMIPINEVLIDNFQKTAKFDYTIDQKRSVTEILNQMSSNCVMDRLLIGDVGFGKTEVAMNAIVAVAKSSFQSLFVVPTTLLSFQHFKSLKDRLKKFDITVARLDRFNTTKEKNLILQKLKDGALDVVVGTHTLLNVKVKSLGLVIIDEEHKFGVKQKERLKKLYENAHLLSMSATPIPRSLNMALSQVKTMSELLTPPIQRKEVRTFVKTFNEKLIKEIIKREQRRGGQIFYVFNNIKHMQKKKNQLLDIIADLKIVTLHSQISATITEKELLAFENREYDVMLTTTIIESGLHMPNVNSMIIEDANKFGIADLHQLRGRVGRSSVRGYCYFIVEDKEKLTPQSAKRLIALESNSYLGSGQALAYQDLEIRGGGNLIGDAQSGHIKQIGYSLYLSMLEDAIATLSNKKNKEKIDVDLKLCISAFISKRVVTEDRLRIELYRRLSQCETIRDIYEIQEEVIDRFGVLDTASKQFFELMTIKLLALNKDIKVISNYNENISIEFQTKIKISLKARSKDDDDIINTILKYLRTK